jgi:hypothetical protein
LEKFRKSIPSEGIAQVYDNFNYNSRRNNMDAGLCIVSLMVAGLYFLAWLDGLSKKAKWKERAPELPNPNNRNVEMRRYANGAIMPAIVKFKVRLDFTEYSLRKLEIILQQAYEQYRQAASNVSFPNIPINNTVTTWGSYFGEVIRRSLGGNWVADKKEVFLQLGSRRIDPLGQVRLRITEGPLYNVQRFFQELKPEISKPNYSPGYSRTIHSGSDNIQDYGINAIRSSGKFTPTERAAEYRRRGKSPSGVIDGEYNDAYRGNDEYNDSYRDWDANA